MGSSIWGGQEMFLKTSMFELALKVEPGLERWREIVEVAMG